MVTGLPPMVIDSIAVFTVPVNVLVFNGILDTYPITIPLWRRLSESVK